jgi:hypothetical protein
MSAFLESIYIFLMVASTLFVSAFLASAAGTTVAITNITDNTTSDSFHLLVNIASPP